MPALETVPPLPPIESETPRWPQPARLDDQFIEGIGESRSHVGEGFQGPLEFRDRIVTALITLYDDTLRVRVRVRARPGTGLVFGDPTKRKIMKALRLLIDDFDLDDWDLSFEVLESNIVASVGEGSSSAEIHAALRGAKNALRIRLTDRQVAKLAHKAEKATDPLAMEDWGYTPVWASRQGEVIEIIPAPLPRLNCVALIAAQAKAVSTNHQAEETTYWNDELREFAKIYSRAKNAILRGSARDFVAAGEASLRLNQHRCPTPRLAELQDIASYNEALGVLGSHSGCVAVIAFDGASEGIAGRVRAVSEHADAAGFTGVHIFKVGEK